MVVVKFAAGHWYSLPYIAKETCPITSNDKTRVPAKKGISKTNLHTNPLNKTPREISRNSGKMLHTDHESLQIKYSTSASINNSYPLTV